MMLDGSVEHSYTSPDVGHCVFGGSYFRPLSSSISRLERRASAAPILADDGSNASRDFRIGGHP